MELPCRAKFIDRSTNRAVQGRIESATENDLLAWTRWRYRSDDEDIHWDWWSIFQECNADPGRYECYSAVALTGLQGLMVLDLKRRRSLHRPITVDYLATNPGNRQRDSALKYVGLALIGVAILRSREVGAGGSLWLEALPGAAGFYKNLGMQKSSRKSPEGNLIYSFNPSGAEHLLDEIGQRGILEL
jgi:hypothetical protein